MSSRESFNLRTDFGTLIWPHFGRLNWPHLIYSDRSSYCPCQPRTGRAMDRRRKVELFEQIRREYRFGVGTIRGVAKRFGVHRRIVRQAMASAVPPHRKVPMRSQPKLEPVKEFIDEILQADQQAPRKQRHTAHRIWQRIGAERSEV